MKIITALFSLFIIALALSFALSNRPDVELGLYPFTGTIAVPLYTVALVPLAFGLLVGGIVGWASGIPHRMRTRWLKKELDTLNGKLADLQKNAIEEFTPAGKRKFFWNRKS